jgi:hypothetical protein
MRWEGDVWIYLMGEVRKRKIKEDRLCSLGVGNRNANLIMPNSVKDSQCLTHGNKICRIIEIDVPASKFRRLRQLMNMISFLVELLTLRRRRCHTGSHSNPAASVHSSTAAARSGCKLRTLSSALAERRSKLSQASNKIAEGEVDPGLNIDTQGAVHDQQLIQGPYQCYLSHLPGTFWIRSQTSELMTLTPSISVKAKVYPE